MGFSELTEVKAIEEGGFGVIYRAKHPEWGTVVYKELKSSIIKEGSKSVHHTVYFGFFELRRQSFWHIIIIIILIHDLLFLPISTIESRVS